jgi:putative ABC transport system permease protein
VRPRRHRRLFRLPFRRDGIRQDVDQELRFHMEERAARFERSGMSPEDARVAAKERFGDVERIREDMVEMMMRRERSRKQSGVIDRIGRDISFAKRQILRSPGFSSVAVLTIALAVGATVSIFSVVDGIMLRPLPFENPDQLVMVWADYSRRDVMLPDKRREWLSWPNFADFRRDISAVAAVSAFSGWGPTLTGAGDALQVSGSRFSPGMFSQVLGVQPATGRSFTPEEHAPDGPAAVVLSDGFWRRAFGADPDIVNRAVRLNGQPMTVVGVMPPGFRPPAFLGTDVWAPLQLDMSNGGSRGSAFLRAMGRLSDGASMDLVRGQATQLGLRLEQEFPEANVDVGFNVYPLRSDMVRQTSSALWVLLGSVAFVLLIACVNVANLLLARGATRGGELAVRVALGAGRRRILSQLMTESLALAGLGGLLGIALSFVGTATLVKMAPEGTPLLDQVSVDGRILGFAAVVTVLVGVLFGIVPSLRAARVQPASTLREGGGGGTGARAARLRNTLVVGQVAMALMLLVGAGLLLRSFQNLQRADLGFDPEGVLSMQVQIPGMTYSDAEARLAFFGPLETRLASIPGVRSVGSVTNLPMAGFDGDRTFWVEGGTPPKPGLEPAVWLRRSTPGYFETIGLELESGRSFTQSDDQEATRVIIVNETLERDYFDGQALGKRLNINDPADPIWREVVGVAKDIKNFGIRAESRNAMYIPFAQAPTTFLFTVVRTSMDPEQIINAIRAEVTSMDPGVAVAQLQPMEELVSSSLATDRFTTSLLSGFAVVALILAVVGLYGVVSYSVSTRMREMGVRIALGAPLSGIRKMVLRWALSLAGVGIVLGAIGGMGVTRLIEGLLFGVDTTDLTTFGLMALIMGIAALLASLIPAVRATRVDPINVLKVE